MKKVENAGVVTKKNIVLSTESSPNREPKSDPDSGFCFNLSETRRTPTRVSVSKFKGKLVVDIRQMYRDSESDELKFSKKGISLTQDEFRELVKIFPLLKEAFVEMGGSLDNEGED